MISVIVPVHNGMPWLEDQLAPSPRSSVRAVGGRHRRQRLDRPQRELRTPLRRGPRELPARRRRGRQGTPAARNAGVRASLRRPPRLLRCRRRRASRVAQQLRQGARRRRRRRRRLRLLVAQRQRASPHRPASMRQLGFLPAGLGANLAVRRRAFEDVGGFAEELLVGEDIDLCWRLQLARIPLRHRVRRQGGQAGAPRVQAGVPPGSRLRAQRPGPLPPLPRHGTTAQPAGRPQIVGLAVVPPRACSSRAPSRLDWARAAGMRSGRPAGSLREGVLFPESARSRAAGVSPPARSRSPAPQLISQSAPTKTGERTITPSGMAWASGPITSKDITGRQGSNGLRLLPKWPGLEMAGQRE